MSLGEAAEADAFRLYVRDEVRLAGPFVMNGSLFAPREDFVASNTVTNRGALFAQRIDFAAPVEIGNGPRYTSDACLVWDELDDEVIVE